MMNSEYKNKITKNNEIFPFCIKMNFSSYFDSNKNTNPMLKSEGSKCSKALGKGNKRNIGNLSNIQQQQPLMGWDGIITESPSLKELNKQIFFPLTNIHKYRKESLLTKTSTAYLNSVHPQKLRVNLNKTPSKKLIGLRVAPSKTSDVIYEYLKSFSQYCNRKKGVLINFNQHIAYNFNKKNLLLRGAEPLTEPLINNSLKIKTNKNQSTKAVPLLHLRNELLPRGPKESNAQPLLVASVAFAKRTVARSAPAREANVHRQEANEEWLLRLNRLNRLNGVSGETGYNRKGNNRLIKYSYKLLFYFFKSMYCIISKPVFIFTPDKVVIQLHYFLNIPKFKVFKWYSIFKDKKIRQYRDAVKNKNNKIFNWSGRKYSKQNKKVHWKVARTLIRLKNKRIKVKNNLVKLNKYNLFRVFSLKFKLICEILNNKFNKPIELQLIRLHKPYQDSNILVNLLSLNIKNKKFRTNVEIAKLFQKRVVKNVDDYLNKSVNFIPTYLSGIKINIGGRLMREHLIPKISKKRYERGASSVGKVNFLDTASITKKNRKGSYTLKISSGQNFF